MTFDVVSFPAPSSSTISPITRSITDATEITITHNFGRRPIEISVINSDGIEVGGILEDYSVDPTNVITLSWDTPITGTVVLS